MEKSGYIKYLTSEIKLDSAIIGSWICYLHFQQIVDFAR